MQGLGILSIIIWIFTILMNISAYFISIYLFKVKSDYFDYTEGNPLMKFCIKHKLGLLFLLISYLIYSVVLSNLLKIKVEWLAVVFVVIIAVIWGIDFIADLRQLFLYNELRYS